MSAAAGELAAELAGETGQVPEGEHEPEHEETAEHGCDDEPEPGEPDPVGERAAELERAELPATGEAEPSRKQLAALDAEQRRHVGRVQSIMGGYVAGFEECEHCAGIGLVPPGPKPQTHEHFRACETCAGFGEVLTGSRRAGNESRDCPGCGGRGYVEALDESGMPLAGRPAGTVAGGSASAPAQGPGDGSNGQPASAADRFGVPAWMGDPNLSPH